LIDAETLWILSDHLNSTRKILRNENNQITTVASIDYDAFGNIVTGTNPINISYTGKYFDVITNLQWNINRWYDPQTGQWMSEDPIGFNGGDVNLYRYVGNDVINMVDTEGLDTTSGSKSNVSTTSDKITGNSGGSRHMVEVRTILWRFGIFDFYYAGRGFPNEADKTAEEIAKRYVDDKDYNQERYQNAIRHTYWQAVVAYEYGFDAALAIAEAHEYGEKGTKDNFTDIHNNDIGRRIGMRYRRIFNSPEMKNCKIKNYKEFILYDVINALENNELIKSHKDTKIPEEIRNKEK
jgi:RHS repeat-associated protein